MLSGLFILFSGCQKDLEFLNTEADGYESAVSTRNGPTLEDQIVDAIDNGVAWLAGQQNPDGSWGDYEPIAHTAFALVKLQDYAYEHGDDPFDPGYQYYGQVDAGYDFLLPHLTPIDIEVQPWGDPDFNGNGIGVYMTPSGGHRYSYNASITLMALVTSRKNPNEAMTPAPYADATWGSVVQDIVDYFAFGQADDDSDRGGWGYEANYKTWGGTYWCDNSNSGYVVLGLDFAQAPQYGFNATVPEFVKDELQHWIGYIQNANGGSGYSDPNEWVNVLKTGNLIYQMAFVGYPENDARVVNAVGYIESQWNANNRDPGFRNPYQYQAMYAVMKGLERMGIKTIDVGGEFDWFSSEDPEGFARMIVDSQIGGQYWSGDLWGGDLLSTIWALLTLEKVVPVTTINVFVDVKPTSCPNPINRKSKGKIPLAILGTDDFDVSNIDPSTVAIFHEFEDDVVGEAFATHWSYEDVATPYEGELDDIMDCTTEGSDGFTDLVLHFKTQDVVEAYGDYLADMDKKDMLILEVKGQLDDDGPSLYGKDVMKIVK